MLAQILGKLQGFQIDVEKLHAELSFMESSSLEFPHSARPRFDS